MSQANMEKQIKKLFDLLGVSVELKIEEVEDVLNIDIDTQETGILIGFHGETLHSLQNMIGLIVFNQFGEWKKINLNIGDYMEKREEKLISIAESAAENAIRENQSITLPYFNAKERRIIHIHLKDRSDIKTESVGEDEERRLVIFPQN